VSEEATNGPTISYPYENHCSFKQSSDLSFPVVTALDSDSTTITLTGADFMADDYTAMVQVAEVNADLVQQSGPNTVVAEWFKGVPPVTAGTVSFWFEDTNSTQVYYADTSAVTIENTLNIASVADVSCSFAGGCTY
jgi:hypothetical protein